MGALTDMVQANYEFMWMQNVVVKKIPFFEKTFAHRDCVENCKKQTQEACMTVIIFLTDLKNISSLESYGISKLENICFRGQLRVQFVQEIQYNLESEETFPIGFPTRVYKPNS